MRVIAGKYKRRTLVTVPGNDVTRPTSDRVKENMFNFVASELDGATVLDLFAGSGALGIEALSRGAKKVIFVEKNFLALKAIQANLDSLGIGKEQYDIVKSDVSDFLVKAQLVSREKVEIIFADPPYKTSWYETSLLEIDKSSVASRNCIFVVEMPVGVEVESSPILSHWSQRVCRNYGKTRVEIWEKKNSD